MQLALPELVRILTAVARSRIDCRTNILLKWNRDPEEFDFRFVRDGEGFLIEIYQYPTEERDAAERELVYSHSGTVSGYRLSIRRNI